MKPEIIALFAALATASALSACSSSSNNDVEEPVTPIADDSNPGTPTDSTPLGQPEEVVTDSSSPILSLENYQTIVRNVLGVYTGDAYGPAVVTLPGYSDNTYVNTLELTDARDSAVCTNGGTAELATVSEGDRVITKTTTFEFDNCQDGTNLFDGNFKRTLSDTLSVGSTGLMVEDQSQRTGFSGNASISQGNEFGGGPTRLSWYTNGLTYSVATSEAVLNIENATSAFQRVIPFNAIMSGGFTFSSVETGNHRLKAEITQDFDFNAGGVDGPNWERRDDWNFETGSMTITADDGSSIVLDAATGDIDTVSVSLTSGTETSEFLEPWSTWSDNLTANNWLYDGFYLYQQ